MKKCPYCTEEIQEGAVVCERCGNELRSVPTPPVDPAATREAMRKIGRNALVSAGAVIVVVSVFALIYDSLQSSPPTSPTTSADFGSPLPTATARASTVSAGSPERQLAELDCRCVVSEDDTTLLRFRYLLDDVNRTTGLSRSDIAELTARAQKAAKDYGRDLKLLDLMETARNVVAAAGGTPDYKRALAAVVAQRVQ